MKRTPVLISCAEAEYGEDKVYNGDDVSPLALNLLIVYSRQDMLFLSVCLSVCVYIFYKTSYV